MIYSQLFYIIFVYDRSRLTPSDFLIKSVCLAENRHGSMFKGSRWTATFCHVL